MIPRTGLRKGVCQAWSPSVKAQSLPPASRRRQCLQPSQEGGCRKLKLKKKRRKKTKTKKKKKKNKNKKKKKKKKMQLVNNDRKKWKLVIKNTQNKTIP
jgi:hypothetical protein